MKRILLLSLVFCLAMGAGRAQTLSNVDLAKVYTAIDDKESPFYYPSLLERYLAHDSLLTVFDYHYLYYGFTKQKGYDPYGRGSGERKAMQLIEEGKLDEAREILLADFNTAPFNMNVIFRLGSLADQQQKPAEARQWLLKFDGLLRTIMQSGDGLTEETAWVVITAQDEYPVLGVLGLEATGQGLLKRKYDVQTLKTPNEMKAEKLFFNIEVPFGHLAKTFNTELVEADKKDKPKKVKKIKEGTASN